MKLRLSQTVLSLPAAAWALLWSTSTLTLTLALVDLQSVEGVATGEGTGTITGAKTLSSDKCVQLPLVPHHIQKTRRALDQEVTTSSVSSPRRRQDALQVGALYQGYGTHYVDLWVGTPSPQRQTLIVDTGSGVTAFPCSGCGLDCGSGHHVDDFFDENQSTTFVKAACDSCKRGHCSGNGGECRISMSYQEGSSWSAFEAIDQAYIGGPHDHGLAHDNGGTQDIDPEHAAAFAFPMTFGCQTHLTGLFKTQLADGIMGMDDADSSFWSQMNDAGIIPNKQFSLCFTRQDIADKGGTEAGAMTMGGSDDRLHSSPMVYTTRVGGRSGFYTINVRKFYLRDGSGGDRARPDDPKAKLITLDLSESQLNHGNVILDSGTTDTYFTRTIAQEFNSAYRTLTGEDYSHKGVSLTEEQLRALPTILIQISGDDETNKKLYPDPSKISGLAGDLDNDHPYDVILAIPASHYMEFDDKVNKYVARFYPDEGGGSVIGANAMMGHDIFFNVDEGIFGFAESDCDYGTLVTSAGFDDKLSRTGGGGSIDTTPTSIPDKKKPTQDKPDSQNGADTSDAETGHKVHPVVEACSDMTCRMTVGAVLIVALAVGLLIGRYCCQSKKVVYRLHGGEMEMNALDDFADVRYRDEPGDDDDDDDDDDENGVALEGTGYKDEPMPRSLA